MNVKDNAQAGDLSPLDTTCNCIYMPYGDGASFSGYRAKPWPIPGNASEHLTFRGIKNFDATVAWALAHGMDKATDVVLTGGSAGGLSTFLHMDRLRAVMAKVAPAAVVRGAPVVGFFLDHGNFAPQTGLVPNTKEWESSANYTAKMKWIYQMQNLTFGADGGLMPACQKANPANPHYCFMSPHMQRFIETPFFFFNSRFDAWQLSQELQTNWETAAEQAAVVQYGADFLTQFKPLRSEAKNGAFITTCICHGCAWNELKDNWAGGKGLTSYQHYAAWMVHNVTGADALTVDTRPPNGGGAITPAGGGAGCKKFP
jgi:hypothetical protein|tara:strand:- start:298 stop:1242 length:945 start_codon:yes stop_codon:yes gene_type:complete